MNTTKTMKEIWGVTKRKGSKDFWTRIGVAFENSDGSFNLLFDYYPTNPDTTVQLRDRKPRDADDGV